MSSHQSLKISRRTLIKGTASALVLAPSLGILPLASAKEPIKKFGFVWAPGLEKLPKKGQYVLQTCAKMKPKTCQDGPQMGPRRWPGGTKSGGKTPSKQKGREHATDPPFLAEKVANVAPTWAPRWSPNRTKIDAEIK